MPSFTRATVGKTVDRMRAGLRHAFATPAASGPLSFEDEALLHRVAAAIVHRGMGAPAVVFLESLGPMNFLGSQALHFVTPIVELAFRAEELDRIARLLERRETPARLIALIEAQSAR